MNVDHDPASSGCEATSESRPARRGREGWVRLAAALGAALVVVGCSSATQYKWMSRFFDGVPVPGATNVVQVEEEPVPGPISNVVMPEPGDAPLKTLIAHDPFLNNACNECHESKFSQKMKGPMNAVCFACHDDFTENLKVKHQPAESECTACHNPHEAPNKKLLILTGKALCMECHDDPTASGKVKHQPAEGDCLECHSAHATNFKGLLKKPVAQSCFECHDDFLANATVKHDPAANGECMECHSAHASNFKGLLVKADPQVCFECHEEADILKTEAHKRAAGSEQLQCMKCHDPHGGTEKYLLKPGVLKGGGR